MPVTIEKTFRFDAGHRCLGFKNAKESTLHGHTWHLRLVIETASELDPFKTIFDTNDLARIVKPMVDRFDHAFIVWSEDPLADRLVALAKDGGFADKFLCVDFNPTVEGLVEHFFKVVKAQLPPMRAVLKRADLDATATLRATYWE